MRALNVTVALFFALLTLAIVPSTAGAQCCSPGNPIGGGSILGALPEGEGRIAATYSYSLSRAYYRGSRVVEPFFVDGGYYHHLSVNGAYAISNRVTVESDITYFAGKVQEYVDGSVPSSRRGSGVGDWAAMMQVNLIRNRRTRWELTGGAGIKFPLGSYRQTRNGALLPLDIQPTTGAVDFRYSLFVYKGFPARGLRFFAVGFLDVKTTNPDGYRYGNLLSTSVYVSTNFGLRWDASLQARGEFRAMDRRASGPIPVTGSTRLFVTPQVSYAFDQKLVATTFVDVPIFQYYQGSQLGSTIGFGLSLIKKFGIGKPEENKPPLFR